MQRVTIVLVVHNSTSVLDTLFDRLSPFPHVVAVDNASRDGTPERIRALRPDATVIANPYNSGYGYASNLGFAAAKTDYALQINPDAEFGPGDVLRLVAMADVNSNVAGVAPRLVDEFDTLQLSVMGPRERHHRAIAAPPDGAFCTWFLMAAIILWRLDALRALGGFDVNIFLYEEDADLCLRATKAGYALIVEPAAIAVHRGGASEKVSAKTRWRKDWNQAWSHFYYEDKHGTPGSGRAKAARSLLPLFLKGLGGIARFRAKTVIGQFARFAAAVRYLRGGPAWARPEMARKGALPLCNPLEIG